MSAPRRRPELLKGLAASAAAVALLAPLAPPAAAQVPVPLIPGVPSSESESAAPPAPSLRPQPLAGPRIPIPAPAPGIEVGQLAAVDPSVIGLLREDTGGLGFDLWAGSDRGRIERLLPRLPMGTLSPAVQTLAMRLLLSAAAPPEGAPPAPSGPSLLGLRMERLMAGGRVAAVNELLALAAASAGDPVLARAEVDARLLVGDNAGACARVPDLVRTDPRPYWTKALAFCRALEDDRGAVSLAVSLLRDQGHVGDGAFFTLVRALIGESDEPVATLIDPEPLHIAMMRAARRTIPADAVAGARPSVLWAIALAPNDSLDTRLDAAVRAEAAGALETAVLAEMFAAVPYAAADIDAALDRAEAGAGGARLDALLYQAAIVWEDPGRRATAVQRALRDARDRGAGFGTVARMHLPVLRAIKPSVDLLWFAGDAARALLLAGETTVAWAWLDLCIAEAARSATAHMTAAGLWPLLQLADADGAALRDAARARLWWQLPPGGDGAELADRALLYALFDALGDPPPAAAWDPLFDAPLTVAAYRPSAAVTPPPTAASALPARRRRPRPPRRDRSARAAGSGRTGRYRRRRHGAPRRGVGPAPRRPGRGRPGDRAGGGGGAGIVALPARATVRAPASGARLCEPAGDRHVEAFLEMMAAERSAARATLDGYRRDLADLAAFAVARRTAVIRNADAGERMLQDYFTTLSRRGLATATVARRLATVRQFSASRRGIGTWRRSWR